LNTGATFADSTRRRRAQRRPFLACCEQCSGSRAAVCRINRQTEYLRLGHRNDITREGWEWQIIPFRVWHCAISVAAVYDRRPFISRKISAVIDRRYSAKANFKWYHGSRLGEISGGERPAVPTSARETWAAQLPQSPRLRRGLAASCGTVFYEGVAGVTDGRP